MSQKTYSTLSLNSYKVDIVISFTQIFFRDLNLIQLFLQIRSNRIGHPNFNDTHQLCWLIYNILK